MKSSTIFKISVLCVLILSSCSKGIKLHELIFKDNLYYKADSKEPFSGKVYETYISGKDSLIAELDNGLFNGDYLMYYQTGTIKDSVQYKKGTIIKYKSFLKNGLIMKTPEKLLFLSKQGLTCIVDKKKDTVLFSGLALRTFQDPSYSKGEIFVFEENYINGEKNGNRTGYYPSGKLYYTDEYINGKQNGRDIVYYENGTLQREANWKNGSQVGKWRTYHKNGKTDEIGNYKNGQKDSTWNEYYENGRIEFISNYSNGVKNGNYIAYFENGNVKARGVFQNNMREGDWTFYNSNGSIDSQQKFSQGNALSKCQCCGRYYNYNEGWTARNPGFSRGAWDVFADGGAGGGPYCSKGCARRCE